MVEAEIKPEVQAEMEALAAFRPTVWPTRRWGRGPVALRATAAAAAVEKSPLPLNQTTATKANRKKRRQQPNKQSSRMASSAANRVDRASSRAPKEGAATSSAAPETPSPAAAAARATATATALWRQWQEHWHWQEQPPLPQTKIPAMAAENRQPNSSRTTTMPPLPTIETSPPVVWCVCTPVRTPATTPWPRPLLAPTPTLRTTMAATRATTATAMATTEKCSSASIDATPSSSTR